MREMRECQNPICQNQIEPVASDNGKKVWRRTPRRFCSEWCKKDYSALRRAAEMLSALGPAERWDILQGLLEDSAFTLLKKGDGQDKAKGEIINCGAV